MRDETITFEEFAETETMQWDFLYRTERTNFKAFWAAHSACTKTAQLPVGWDAQAALEYMRANKKLGRGSSRSGCFEIQTDLGVWSQANGTAMRFDTPRKAAKVTYRTWEEIIAEEENESN